MCARCDWDSWLETIEEMLADGDYDFAMDTLSGICNWVKENKHITDGQIKAVENIKAAVE